MGAKEIAIDWGLQTRWYRAPEVLLGGLVTTAIDVWSVGCIMAELLRTVPLFAGGDALNQLEHIMSVLGTPKETAWPGVTSLPGYHYITGYGFQPCPLRPLFAGHYSDSALDLLSALLTYDPSKRVSAADALKHPFFLRAPSKSH
jgi:serine/threonine protein kinase